MAALLTLQRQFPLLTGWLYSKAIMGAFQMQGLLWLAIRNKCLTADHLAKRGTAHPDNWRQWSTSSQNCLCSSVLTQSV
jgi:hypothetical protein